MEYLIGFVCGGLIVAIIALILFFIFLAKTVGSIGGCEAIMKLLKEFAGSEEIEAARQHVAGVKLK